MEIKLLQFFTTSLEAESQPSVKMKFKNVLTLTQILHPSYSLAKNKVEIAKL